MTRTRVFVSALPKTPQNTTDGSYLRSYEFVTRRLLLIQGEKLLLSAKKLQELLGPPAGPGVFGDAFDLHSTGSLGIFLCCCWMCLDVFGFGLAPSLLFLLNNDII